VIEGFGEGGVIGDDDSSCGFCFSVLRAQKESVRARRRLQKKSLHIDR
jgi:hypothetical protein